MRNNSVVLESRDLRVVIEPSRGCEISSIHHIASETEILMRTPWASHAELVPAAPLPYPAESSAAQWTESYAGGWQILFPHAGAPASVDGVVRHYHGESSWIAWLVGAADSRHLRASATLVTVPVHILRTIALARDTVTVTDTIVNDSMADVRYDYVHHPVFGEDFLGDGGSIETSASTFTSDPSVPPIEFRPGSIHEWPLPHSVDEDQIIDLSVVPKADLRIGRFGYLGGYPKIATAIFESAVKDVSARLQWDGEDFGYAWFWQQVKANTAAPWFGREYAIAIEPSTTPSDGPRGSTQVLAGQSSRTYSVSLTVRPRRGP